MEKITSRKNQYIARLRLLSSDGDFRRETGEFVLDGIKLLQEATENGAEVTSVLWGGEPLRDAPAGAAAYVAAPELLEYASPLKSSPGPVFTVKLPRRALPALLDRAVILENVQDPGNVGTVVRAAAAFGVDAVILAGACADLYAPRTARATMGAIFRQTVLETETDALGEFLRRYNLKLFGAALSEDAEDIRSADLTRAAVAIGNEGTGLSEKLIALCEKTVIIPMSPKSESLNAAMAATVVMWEMVRQK